MRPGGVAAVIAVLLACVLGAFLITRGAAFGGQPAGERLARAARSPQWRNGQFASPQPLWSDTGGAWRRLVFGPSATNADPAGPLAVVRSASSALTVLPASGLRVTWFGHSSALVEIDGVRVLVDPFWSDRASPVQWAGPRRWYPAPVALTDLPVDRCGRHLARSSRSSGLRRRHGDAVVARRIRGAAGHWRSP